MKYEISYHMTIRTPYLWPRKNNGRGVMELTKEEYDQINAKLRNMDEMARMAYNIYVKPIVDRAQEYAKKLVKDRGRK